MKNTQMTLIRLVLVMMLGLASTAYGGKLVLDVEADTDAFDAAFADIKTGCAFYVPGKIFEAGTSNEIGTFHCWGWDVACDGGITGAVVVSQEFNLDGRGKIQVQGVEDQGPRAVTGGTGEFRNVRGEMTGADLSGFPDFTVTFKLIGAKN